MGCITVPSMHARGELEINLAGISGKCVDQRRYFALTVMAVQTTCQGPLQADSLSFVLLPVERAKGDEAPFQRCTRSKPVGTRVPPSRLWSEVQAPLVGAATCP